MRGSWPCCLRCKIILRNLHEAVAVPSLDEAISSQWPRLLVLEQVLPEDSDTSAMAQLARTELDDAGLWVIYGGRERRVSEYRRLLASEGHLERHEDGA